MSTPPDFAPALSSTPVDVSSLGLGRPRLRFGRHAADRTTWDRLPESAWTHAQPTAADGWIVRRQPRPLAAAEVAHLDRVIAFRTRLAAADREYLDAVAAWPRALVVDDGGVVGVVLPRAAGESGELAVTRPDARHDLATRVLLGLQLAGVVAFLHRRGVSHGALTADRLRHVADPEPATVLLGCEDVRLPGEGDAAADDRDLTALLRRLLRPRPGDDPADAARLGDLDLDPGRDPGRDRDLDLDHGPTAADWADHLRAYVLSSAIPPTVEVLEVDRPVVFDGQSVTLTWRADRATRVTVQTPDGLTYVLPGAEGTTAVSPGRSGQLTLTADNRWGTVQRLSAPVAVFTTPQISGLRLDTPAVPTPSRVDLDRLGRTLDDATASLDSAPTPAAFAVRGGELAALHRLAREATPVDALRDLVRSTRAFADEVAGDLERATRATAATAVVTARRSARTTRAARVGPATRTAPTARTPDTRRRSS